MKPTVEELAKVFVFWHRQFIAGEASPATLANRLNEKWAAAWSASEAERESVWHSFHRAWTACVGTKRYDKAPWRECAKQVGGVVGPMGHAGTAPPAADADLPSEDEVVGILSEARLADDVERFNQEQRVARDAFAAGVRSAKANPQRTPEQSAAVRYPLKKRVPKVIPDPHGAGEWRLDEDSVGAFFVWRHDQVWEKVPAYVLLTPTRVETLRELSKAPWTYEESTEVEE